MAKISFPSKNSINKMDNKDNNKGAACDAPELLYKITGSPKDAGRQ